MSVSDELERLKRLGQKRHVSQEDFLEFESFVEELPYERMEELLSERLELPDGLQLVSLLFAGLSMKGASQKKRTKLFEFLLTQTHVRDLPPRCVSGVLTWLAIEIDKLSSTHLIRVCDMCVDLVAKTSQPQRAGWHELLPKILTVLVRKDTVEHYGTETSGEEYARQVVAAIHQARWSPEILTPLAAMFTSVRLSDDEHAKVVMKLCQSVDGLSPEELPPLVYQLLLLTAERNAMTLFFALKKYYNQRIYRLNDSSGMLDTERAAARVSDVTDDIGPSLKELTDSEAMVLFHIESVAQRSVGCVGELIKCAKAAVPSPEALLDPFLLAVLLIVSNVPTYETQLTDLLKKMIVRVVTEEDKRNESDWLRKVLNNFCDIQGIICKLIKSKACTLEGVMKGFLNLSMSLLKTGNKTVAHYGRLIACNLVSKHIVVAGGLLEMVTTNIFMAPEVTQYTDCLDEVCDSSPMTVVDYPKIVNRLLEALPSLPEPAASKVIYALISLLRVSSRLRDNLLMVLRKALFVHSPATRTLAVSGFLQLLKRMKIKGMHSLSQNSFQAYTCPSVFASQGMVDVHVQNANNEGICLEVIQVLKRCFTLQLPVKISFYSGLHSALLKNPELCVPITEIFLEHFRKFYEADEDKLPPLAFSKAMSVMQDKLVVSESLGQLVFVVQRIITTSEQVSVDDVDYAGNVAKLHKMLSSLVDRFVKLSLSDLGFEGDSDARNLSSSDGLVKEETLRQCLNVLQALISYVLFKWDLSATQEDVRALIGLHKTYSTLDDFARSVKTRKDDPKRKTKEPTQTGLLPGKKGTFQFGENVVDFETVFRFLSLLVDEVDWCEDSLAADIQRKPALLRFALTSALDVLRAQKSKLKVHKSRTCLADLSQLGRLVFGRLVVRYAQIREFDPMSSVMGFEVLTELCDCLCTHFKRSRNSFLQEITGMSEDSGLDELLECVLKPYLKTLSLVLDSGEEEEDLHDKRLVASLVCGINLLTLELPVMGTCVNKTYRWLLDLTQTKKFPEPASVKTLVTLLLTLLARVKSDTTLHDNLALQLCGLFGPINETEVEKGTVTLAVVDDTSKVFVYPLLCAGLNSRLDAVDWVVSRIKAEMLLICQPDCSQTDPSSRRAVLSRKEKELVTELGLIVSVSQLVCTAAVPVDCAEVACKLLLHVYQSLVAFTKYFSLRGGPAYRDAHFGRLVKLAASHLSSQVADFLLYVESVHIDADDSSKRTVSAKVLRQAKKQIVYIPRLVAELENFSKCVTQLSVKCKDPNLVANLRLTTARDFRLNTKKLEEAMKRGRDSDTDEDPPAPTSSAPPQPTQTQSTSGKGKKQLQKRRRTK